MINYKDPRFQQLLMRRAAMTPYGGTQRVNKETAAWAGDQTKTLLNLGEVSDRDKMNKALMREMLFKSGMAEKRLGLDEGYLGLRERGIGLGERGLGVDEQRLGIRSAFQGLSEREGAWRNREYMRNLADKESALNLSTWLGLGQAAWGGYEGFRRAKLTEEDTARRKKQNTMIEDLYNRGGGGYRGGE